MSGASYKSGCACGAVEVEISGDPAVQAFCHCASCRDWLGAPIHAAALWPTPNVNVTKGEDKLGVYKKTDASHRHFCRDCGTPVFVRHPAIGMTDVPAGGVRDLDYRPGIHVHYQEKVLSVKDGLPKYKDFPKELGGSGATLPD